VAFHRVIKIEAEMVYKGINVRVVDMYERIKDVLGDMMNCMKNILYESKHMTNLQENMMYIRVQLKDI
jgi:hypothetical protein